MENIWSILFVIPHSNQFILLQSYTLNITTVQGFETFISSLRNKSFSPAKEGSGVDLVLSCVDNYEARMAVNQVSFSSIYIVIYEYISLFTFTLTLIFKILYRLAMS